ncbi:aspartate/glutamate racemase family protein [Mitsuokella jalaludinii]|mgnify:CR=1 FL=1|uniref:aspartate/glutamate racemase family protein n=1 Tax=Mitsuokella jalaludinii TaxID=187979 RepID=UPI003F98442B
MLGIIRVLTHNDQGFVDMHGNAITSFYHIPTISRCIPEQYQGVHDEATKAQAIPKIVALAKELEERGAKALLISCAADPGVAEARAAVTIPVLGAGTCVAAVARSLGAHVGVLNLTGTTPPSLRNVLGDAFFQEIAPQGIENTTQLQTPAGKAAAIAALRELECCCDVVALACTGFNTMGLAQEMRPLLSIPIVDPIEASGAIAQQLFLGDDEYARVKK